MLKESSEAPSPRELREQGRRSEEKGPDQEWVTDLRTPPGSVVLSTGCSPESPGHLLSIGLSETPGLIFIMSGGDAGCLVP